MRGLVLTAMFAALACSKQEPPPPSPAPSVSSSAAPAASSAPAPASSVAVVPSASASASPSTPPTEEDYEDEATQAVTAKSLDSQLDALEKEIQAD